MITACGDGAIALPATWSPCACVLTTHLMPGADHPAMSRFSSGIARVENPVSITTAPSLPEKTTMLFIMPQGNATRRIAGATCTTSNRSGVNLAPCGSSHATNSVWPASYATSSGVPECLATAFRSAAFATRNSAVPRWP